jgi:hypothetical protein
MSAHASKHKASEDVLIEVGRAQLVAMEALADLAGAVVRLEGIVMAIARGLDATAKKACAHE